MIKSIIFDLGGVLIDWNPRYLYNKLIEDEQEVEKFLASITTHEWNLQQDAGRSFEEACTSLEYEHPLKGELIWAYFKRWEEMLGGPIEKSVDILHSLDQKQKSGGANLFALTNWSYETFPIAQERFDFLKIFQDIIVSGVEKMKKPDHEIFELAERRFEVDPKETLFIDDSLENIMSAKELNFVTHQFKSPEILFFHLKEHGLL